jgi:hypothetical protein
MLQVTDSVQKYGVVWKRHVQRMSSVIIPEEGDFYENILKMERLYFLLTIIGQLFLIIEWIDKGWDFHFKLKTSAKNEEEVFDDYGSMFL